METAFFRKVFAVLIIVTLLTSFMAVGASAAETETSATEITEHKISDCANDQNNNVCYKLGQILGTTSTVKYSDTATDTCKYSTSITLPDKTVKTVYLSQKLNTGDVGVQMEDGKLVIDGISSDDTSSWNQIFSRFKGVIVGITGVGTLVMIVLFIVQFMKLGASAGNPQARSQALTGVLWTGIAAALLGSVTIVVGFFYNAI